MRIHLANYQPDRQGGGWSFARNFVKGMGDMISDYESSTIYFITSASMTTREQVAQAKADGKKIVLRVDNILRPSRNRGGGMTHMKDYAEAADLIIYQSDAARLRVGPFLGKNGPVILNSTDEEIFYPGSIEKNSDSYLYSRFNRDETKGFEQARDYFATLYRKNPGAKLNITGQFSQELIEYNFDFFNGETPRYLGVVKDPVAMADIYRDNTYLIYTYWQDACSNTLIEALMCGMIIDFPDEYYRKGSANEIMDKWDSIMPGAGGREYFSLKRMCDDYKKEMVVL